MVLISAALALAMQTNEPVRLSLRGNAGGCEVRAGDALLAPDELKERGRAWARERRPVAIYPDIETPYHCIGGTIFELQVAGIVDVRFDYGSRLKLVQVGILSGRCCVTVDGAPVGFARLRREASNWARTGTLVHLDAIPEADFDCLDRVLKILIKTPGIKLGFVGNEEEAPAPQP